MLKLFKKDSKPEVNILNRVQLTREDKKFIKRIIEKENWTKETKEQSLEIKFNTKVQIFPRKDKNRIDVVM